MWHDPGPALQHRIPLTPAPKGRAPLGPVAAGVSNEKGITMPMLNSVGDSGTCLQLCAAALSQTHGAQSWQRNKLRTPEPDSQGMSEEEGKGKYSGRWAELEVSVLVWLGRGPLVHCSPLPGGCVMCDVSSQQEKQLLVLELFQWTCRWG